MKSNELIDQMRERIRQQAEAHPPSGAGGALRQRITQLRGEAQAAIAAYERGCAALYVRSRPSGHRVARYGEAQMQELLGELKAERNGSLRAIEQEAKELLGEAPREAELAEQFALDVVLSASERDAVGQRMVLIERDVASLRDAALESTPRRLLSRAAPRSNSTRLERGPR
jgi:hypothetical protein